MLGPRLPKRETPTTPPPTLSARWLASIERRRAATRAIIVEAAQQVFASANYAEAKIDDIIRTAGLSRATFYSHSRRKPTWQAQSTRR